MQPSRALAAGALLIGLAACSSGSSSGPTTAPPKADVVITAIEGIHWDAASYTAKSANGKVIVRGDNQSSLPHNLYIIGADGKQNASHVDLPTKGKQATEAVDITPGTYSVICKIPGHTGMKATLTVT
ncbi:MAG: plastocyanin/azurin family copper-binding protein [Ilumatobacteraceae bacterium]